MVRKFLSRHPYECLCGAFGDWEGCEYCQDRAAVEAALAREDFDPDAKDYLERMSLDEYQREALKTAPRGDEAFGPSVEAALRMVASSTADVLRKKLDQMIWSLGLVGEAGEFADLMKKVHGHGKKLDRETAIKELGDVMWYVAALAASLDTTLSEVARVNVEKLRERYPNGFSIQASSERKDVK